MSTFSEMAEDWMRKRISPTESLDGETEATQKETSRASDAWREDFISWALERCAFRDGRDDSAGVGCLLVDFAEWCIAHDAVPCTRETLEELLEESGFPLRDGMALGLILKVDLDVVICSQVGIEAPNYREREAGIRGGSHERRSRQPNGQVPAGDCCQ